MEGENCQTIKDAVHKRLDDDLHDSGCEQSPTTPSPIRDDVIKDSEPVQSSVVITYDRVSWYGCRITM